MIIQFCGLSGSGKTTLANAVKEQLTAKGIATEIIDGDEYRKELCSDLGFSKEDRNRNIRRLAFVASKLSKHNIIAIICAINPYEAIRSEIKDKYPFVKSVFINCPMDVLKERDTKGLYRKAFLPDGHPDKISNLTGVNDPFEIPVKPDLTINSDTQSEEESIEKLLAFILTNLESRKN